MGQERPDERAEKKWKKAVATEASYMMDLISRKTHCCNIVQTPGQDYTKDLNLGLNPVEHFLYNFCILNFPQ